MQVQTARLLAGFFFTVLVTASQAMPLTSADAACQNLGARLDNVTGDECRAAKLSVANTTSVHGQPILLRDYPATSSRGAPQRVLLIGGIHGDELSSVAIVFEWMRRLAAEKFQPFYWRVVPCVNPDGVLANPSTRVNARGVDLNRNFATPEWAAKATQYWQTKNNRDPRRFPGLTAASEPETRWLQAQIRSFRPDAIVSVHAPYGVLDFDGPRTPPRKLGFLNLNELGTYPGSLGNYAGEYLGIPVITLELPRSQSTPTPSQSARIWSDLLTWLERSLPKSEAPLYRHLDDPGWIPPKQ